MGTILLALISSGLLGYIVRTLHWVLVTGPTQAQIELQERETRRLNLEMWYNSLEDFYDVEPPVTIPDTIVEFTSEVFEHKPQSVAAVNQLLKECYMDLPGSTIVYKQDSRFGPPPEWIQEDIKRINIEAHKLRYQKRDWQEKYLKED